MAIEQVQGSSGSLRTAQGDHARIGVMTVFAEKMLFAAMHESVMLWTAPPPAHECRSLMQINAPAGK
jgi:hypothetical protein